VPKTNAQYQKEYAARHPEMKLKALWMPRSLEARLKAYCEIDGLTQSGVMNRALDQFLRNEALQLLGLKSEGA
jgi:hypothetical protein